MSKTFRPWKFDEPLLLPPMVQDFVAEDHLPALCWTWRGIRDKPSVRGKPQSERIQGWLRREFQIADIGSQSQSDT
jgi:hypothetical protein